MQFDVNLSVVREREAILEEIQTSRRNFNPLGGAQEPSPELEQPTALIGTTEQIKPNCSPTVGMAAKSDCESGARIVLEKRHRTSS